MASHDVERWGIFELTLEGPADGNPFMDVTLEAVFRFKNRVVPVEGFYDGGGIYKVRFMPDTVGAWQYETKSNCDALNGRTGEFACVAASPGNHGPVRVVNSFHFAYEDGTPHYSVGTTCYVWNHQGDALEEQTLATLEKAPFNKIRMCVFPKHYSYNQNEPDYHPFEGCLEDGWDFTRFNPPFWQHLEKRIGNLMALGIEADLILFHPYDRWGYSKMDAETDDRYLHYVVARLAAYRNVWWSFANEYDLMRDKTMLDWDRFFRIVQTSDPAQHLRGVHNCRTFYDHSKPWVTHCSIQHRDTTQTTAWRDQYRKPVVDDECCYEGNIHQGWGNITAQELVKRFWDGFVLGGYVGHGETYLHPEDILWWSKGGVLHGQSAARIQFLRDIMEEGPGPIDPQNIGRGFACGGFKDEYYLAYLGPHQSAVKPLSLPEGAAYRIEIIDTWEMTITPVAGTFTGKFDLAVPAKPYMALRIRKVE